MQPSGVPHLDLRRVADAQRRFEAALAGLDDAVMRRRSALPVWTVGHVLTHVARNADSHARRAEAAARGETVEQYPGGPEGRRRAIEDGATRTAAVLVDDVHRSGERLWEVWRSLPGHAWDMVTQDVGGRTRPLRDLPARRWQELEVHLVDLALGVTQLAWSDDFVAVWLPRLRATLVTRLPAGAEPPPPGALTERDELAWLYGRLNRAGLPELAAWG